MISIIVPIYNSSNFLDECLHSIYLQDYKDFEVLCIDDGSIDNSAEIVLKYTEFDKRFKLFQQSNSGVSIARNVGLMHARGEYICFVDSDDMIATNYLSTLWNYSKDGNFVISSYTRNIVGLGELKNKVKSFNSFELITKILEELIIHPNLWSMIFKTEIIRKYDINFYPGCVRNEDTEFYIKYLVHEKNDIILIDYKGYFYRDNPNSAMHITNRNAFTSFQASERIEKYLTEHGLLMNYNKFLFASIQAYTVRLARERNVKLYDELHELYDVPLIMRSLIRHPRFLRSIVALVYLLLGKKVFYKMLSITGI